MFEFSHQNSSLLFTGNLNILNIRNLNRLNMIFRRENSNKTFLVISNNVEQDILFSMHNFQKKGKVPSTDFPLLWKFEVFSIFGGGKHYAQKRWFKNDDAYCGGDVHIIHTWVNGLHILIFSINLVKCTKQQLKNFAAFFSHLLFSPLLV